MILIFRSVSPSIEAQSGIDEDCSTDYIWVGSKNVIIFEQVTTKELTLKILEIILNNICSTDT